MPIQAVDKHVGRSVQPRVLQGERRDCAQFVSKLLCPLAPARQRDSLFADFAVGTGAGQIKVGSLAQSEWLSKYNQLFRIEEELGSHAYFAGLSALSLWSGRGR